MDWIIGDWKAFKLLVRPILEYGHCTVRPSLNKDIDALEAVQRRMTKFSPSLKDLPYEQRLRLLHLPALSYRFLRGDMIELYKLCHGCYDNVPGEALLVFNENHLRRHPLELKTERFYKDVGKWAFRKRVVDTWNSLPE